MTKTYRDKFAAREARNKLHDAESSAI